MALSSGSGVSLDELSADAVAFDNSSNGFTAEQVQAAIEEAKDQAEGFPRAGLPLIYNGTAGNNDLISYSNLTPDTPIIFPVKTKLNEIAFANNRNSVECDLEIWENGVGTGTLVKTVNISTGAGVKFQAVDLNADNLIFDVGDFIQLRYIDQGTNARDMVVVLWISRTS